MKTFHSPVVSLVRYITAGVSLQRREINSYSPWGACACNTVLYFQVIGIPRDCSKFKTKMSSRNALNPIWEETFEIDLHLPELAFIRFNVIDVTSNLTTAQRVIPVNRLRPGYRHLRLHNEQDLPLPLTQLFLCSQFNEEEVVEDDDTLPSDEMPTAGQLNRKRMSFLVVHDLSEQSPYAILKVPETATTKDVIRQAVMKAGNYLTSGFYVTFVILPLPVNRFGFHPRARVCPAGGSSFRIFESPAYGLNWRPHSADGWDV